MLPAMDLIVQQQPHGGGASNVPAFLAKLWKMVDDPETNHLIAWSDEGRSFIIHNQADFSQSLLPYYYKHSNMASFVRQLNMYGFHKVVGVDTGGLKSERQEEMEFAHQFFMRGNEGLLEKIKRKVSANKTAQFMPAMKTERVNEVLNEVSLIRDKQEDLDGKLDTMKKENEALWREVVNLRRKHQSQQKIVNKLIQFLVSMVQPRMSQAVKRRYPNQLAIEDTYPASEEQRLVNTPNIGEVTDIAALDTSGQATLIPTIELPTTPDANNAVHPNAGLVAATLTDQVKVNAMPSTSAQGRPVTPVAPSMQPVDPFTLGNPISAAAAASLQQSGGTMTLTTSPVSNKGSSVLTVSPKRPQLHREISREDFDFEMNLMQNDLDKVKEILSSQITLDSSMISSLFSPEEPLAGLLPDAVASSSDLPRLQLEKMPSAAGAGASDENAPSLFELPDIDDDDPQDTMIQITIPKGAGGGGQDLDLNTPLVLTDNQNPLVSSLKK